MQLGCAHQPQESSIQHGIQLRFGSHGRKATYILENTCNQEIFHIARTIANSKVQCLVIQFEGRKCKRKVAQGSSRTEALVFYGWFKPIENKDVKYKTMWFRPDDKSCCVLRCLQFCEGKTSSFRGVISFHRYWTHSNGGGIIGGSQFSHA